jgi:hypothetical protein
MNNGNGNGHVTVRLREKAERILLSKYDRTVRETRSRHEALEQRYKKQVIKDFGIDVLVKRYKKLKEECEAIEGEVKIKAGRGYISCSDIESGNVDGSKIQKEVDKKVKAELDIDEEVKRLEKLRDELLEELWLAGQPEEVKKILAKMA